MLMQVSSHLDMAYHDIIFIKLMSINKPVAYINKLCIDIRYMESSKGSKAGTWERKLYMSTACSTRDAVDWLYYYVALKKKKMMRIDSIPTMIVAI